MARVITPGMLTALQSPNPKLRFLVSMEFRSGTAYLWTDTADVSWSGHTWLGGARFLSISAIEEGSGVDPKGIGIGISGIDATLLPDVLTDYKLGGTVRSYLAALNGLNAIIADPVLAWSGRMDKARGRIDGKTASIIVNCETRLIDMNVAVDRRRTHDDQQQYAPGDLAFSAVNAIQELTIMFGTSYNASRNV